MNLVTVPVVKPSDAKNSNLLGFVSAIGGAILFCLIAFSSWAAGSSEHGTKVMAKAGDANEALHPELELKGRVVQGGMLFGKVAPGTKVEILGRSVFVGEDGSFVFGLGRDTKSPLVIKTESESGLQKSHSYAVAQREYATQKIEGVAKKYVSPPDEVLARIRRDNRMVKKARNTFSPAKHFRERFIWPAEGPVTGVYGSQRIFNGVPKRPHFGLDIAGPVGTKIVAPNSGVVTMAHDDLYYSGGTLIVDHGQGISSTFIHLSKIHVAPGEQVVRGQTIAEMGATGRVTGPHLDWRINWFDQRLDPALVLPER